MLVASVIFVVESFQTAIRHRLEYFRKFLDFLGQALHFSRAKFNFKKFLGWISYVPIYFPVFFLKKLNAYRYL